MRGSTKEKKRMTQGHREPQRCAENQVAYAESGDEIG
jgi:hypothetical protein